MPALDPDRLLPPEPSARRIARTLYDAVRDLLILSPHGDTDPRCFVVDAQFTDPGQLFIMPDHFMFRMMFSQGVPLADLGVPSRDGGPVETDGRTFWWRIAERDHLFRATSSAHRVDLALREVFSVEEALNAATADAV